MSRLICEHRKDPSVCISSVDEQSGIFQQWAEMRCESNIQNWLLYLDQPGSATSVGLTLKMAAQEMRPVVMYSVVWDEDIRLDVVVVRKTLHLGQCQAASRSTRAHLDYCSNLELAASDFHFRR